MVGQKQRIMRRFEKEAKTKDEAMRKVGFGCACGKCSLAKFSLKEIKKIIYLEDSD